MTSGGVGSMSLTPDERKQEGDEAYDLLIDKLSCGKGYHDETTLLSRGNTFVYTFLISLTFNVWFCTQSAIARAEYRKKCRFTFELMLGWLVRLYNSHCWVFPIVLVSLWALKCRVPKPFWNFLSRSRLLYTKETTENIALDLGNRVQSPFYFPEWASRRIAIAVFDNCLVKFDTSYEGVRADGDGSRQYLLAPPVGGRTAREWSRAEPRVLVYGWVARKTVQFTVIILYTQVFGSGSPKIDLFTDHLRYY